MNVTRDGDACYSIHEQLDGEAYTVTVTAVATVLAEGIIDESGQAIIDCDGTPYVLEDTCGGTNNAASCTLSSCP